MSQLLCLLFISAFWLPLSARAEAAPPAVPSIAVRMVHPDSLELDREGKPVPEGYTPYVYEFRDRHGKMHRERLFLKDEPVITETEVERAGVDPGTPGHLNITLNTPGGRAMKTATSAMRLGHDRLAVVVQGKVNSAPVVQAILSNTFVISGLDKANEAENLAELLNRRAAAGKVASFTPRDLALYAVHPDSDRLVKEGTLSVPGYRLWSRPGAGERKNAEKEYLFLGNAPIVTGDYARSARPNLDYPGHLDIVWNEEAYRNLEQACAALRPGKDRMAVPSCPRPYSIKCLPTPPSFPCRMMTAGWMISARPSIPRFRRSRNSSRGRRKRSWPFIPCIPAARSWNSGSSRNSGRGKPFT